MKAKDGEGQVEVIYGEALGDHPIRLVEVSSSHCVHFRPVVLAQYASDHVLEILPQFDKSP